MLAADAKHYTTLDLIGKNLKKIEKISGQIQFDVVRLDSNDISKIEHLDLLHHLIELSISHNRLIDIRLLARLKTLEILNLSHNSIDNVEPLKHLIHLTRLNLASNNLSSLAPLNSCSALQSIDASDNSLRQIDDFSHLKSLKFLNLRGNLIDRLNSAVKCWPKSLESLVLSDNEINDLTEISYLSSFHQLKSFSFANNPCLYTVNDRYGCHQAFDARPYILNWCLTLETLDDIAINRREKFKAEWLFSQGKGRTYRPGEHEELIQYLIKVCGTDAEQRDDLHLSRVMIEENEMKLISESDFLPITPSSSISQTSQNRYSDYDNRPIQPLDQQSFQTKLKEYPTIRPKSKRHTIAAVYPKTSKEKKPMEHDDERHSTDLRALRTSILQAYLDLHQRFTRTSELQSSALAALWKKFDEEHRAHQRETSMILEENRLLKQRLEELESRLTSPTLHPPLHAHISKRDRKSFFLHWTANPLNDHQTILGYRIYIDDVLKGSTDRDHFEAIIDCIRDEGEYRIKLRTFNNDRESEDSNVVIARFRRHHSPKEPIIIRANRERNDSQSSDLISFSPSSSPPDRSTGIISRLSHQNPKLKKSNNALDGTNPSLPQTSS